MISAAEMKNRTAPIDILEKDIETLLKKKVKPGQTFISITIDKYSEDQVRYAIEAITKAGYTFDLSLGDEEFDIPAKLKIIWGDC